MVCKTPPSTQNKVNTLLYDTERLMQCLMSNQYGDFIISKMILMIIVRGKRTQMLRVSYENTYIIKLKSHI